MTDGLEAARAAVMKAARSFGGPNRGVHGEISEVWVKGALDNYRDVIRADDRASESALRAAAREVVESQESLYGPCEPGCECSIPALKAALEGAPWEPSEGMVERAAVAINAVHVSHGRHDPHAEARAALRAAFSPPPADPPASA